MRKGFTLVEMLIAALLMTLITAGALWSLGQGVRNWRRFAVAENRTQVRSVVTQRIVDDLRSAEEILPAANSSEVFIRTGTSILSYRLFDRKIRREKDGQTAYLTCEDEINILFFAYPGTNLVKITLDQEQFVVGLRN